jgi:hypothetical protein
VIVASSACARLAAFDTRTDSSLQESFHREVKAFDPTNLSIQGITGHHRASPPGLQSGQTPDKRHYSTSAGRVNVDS